jgi:hypothetical protein
LLQVGGEFLDAPLGIKPDGDGAAGRNLARVFPLANDGFVPHAQVTLPDKAGPLAFFTFDVFADEGDTQAAVAETLEALPPTNQIPCGSL